MSADHNEHQHTPEEEREIREAALDQTVEASFPASDPPSTNPGPDDRLRHDPTCQVVAADRRTPLGSQLTLSRLEKAIDWPAIQPLARTVIDWFCAHAYAPTSIPPISCSISTARTIPRNAVERQAPSDQYFRLWRWKG